MPASWRSSAGEIEEAFRYAQAFRPAGLPHPRCQLPAVAALKQPPVLVLRHPHGEHLVPFL
jgi:hypothetical protein